LYLEELERYSDLVYGASLLQQPDTPIATYFGLRGGDSACMMTTGCAMLSMMHYQFVWRTRLSRTDSE